MTRHRKLCIARALFGMWFTLLAVLFVLLTLDRAMSQRLAAAEEDAVRQLGIVSVLPDGTQVIGNIADDKHSFGDQLKEAELQYINEYCTNRNPNNWTRIVIAVVDSAAEYDIDPLLIIAIIETESNFNPHCRGRAGECGLMQVHPFWIGKAEIGAPSEAELKTIEGNIKAGCAIFARNYTDDYVAALGAYNAGGGRRSPVYERKVQAKYREIVEGFYHRLTGRR